MTSEYDPDQNLITSHFVIPEPWRVYKDFDLTIETNGNQFIIDPARDSYVLNREPLNLKVTNPNIEDPINPYTASEEIKAF
jgi:hypothetical protein